MADDESDKASPGHEPSNYLRGRVDPKNYGGNWRSDREEAKGRKQEAVDRDLFSHCQIQFLSAAMRKAVPSLPTAKCRTNVERPLWQFVIHSHL